MRRVVLAFLIGLRGGSCIATTEPAAARFARCGVTAQVAWGAPGQRSRAVVLGDIWG